MSWRKAHSLETLRLQFNRRYPNRSKASDGFIGDTAHQATPSDHNPDRNGIVHAGDFTHDPAVGMDIDRLTDELAATRDPRIKYIIANGWILDSRPQFNPWQWVRYTGSNPHNKHFHLSVMPGIGDQGHEWKLPSFNNAPEVDDLDHVQRTALFQVRHELRDRWTSFLEVPGGGPKPDGLTLLEFAMWNHKHAADLQSKADEQNVVIAELAAKVAEVRGLDAEKLITDLTVAIQEGADSAQVNIDVNVKGVIQ